MKLRDTISGIFCLLLGLGVLTHGVRLGLRVDSEMGPGFFPILAGGMLSVLSLILLTETLRTNVSFRNRSPFWKSNNGCKRVFLTLSATAAFPMVIDTFGFILSTLFLLLFFFRVIAHLRWWTVLTAGFVATAAAYSIFDLWLKANLPSGLLGF